MTILYDSTNMSRLVTILWYNLIQFYKSQTCLDLSQAIRWWNTLKFEQMADEMFWWQSDSLDRCEQVERSKNRYRTRATITRSWLETAMNTNLLHTSHGSSIPSSKYSISQTSRCITKSRGKQLWKARIFPVCCCSSHHLALGY